MKKSDLKPNKETQEEELKRLRKENAKLKSQKEANKTKTSERSKELKKKVLGEKVVTSLNAKSIQKN